MAGSIVEALDDCTSDWMCLCPADMPMLTAQAIGDCAAALGDERIVQPECEGRRRHPVFVSTSLRFELRCFLNEGGTLRGFLHERIIKTVPAQPCSQFRDIDTPQDYERLLEEAGFGRN